MESYELKSEYQGNIICGCCFEGIILAALPDSIIFFQNSVKILPWFSNTELMPEYIVIDSAMAAILTRSGIMFLIPLYSIASDQFTQAWRKFIAKGYTSYVSTTREENLLESIGNCLATRDRAFDNHLEVSIFKFQTSFFTGLVCCANFLVVATKSEIFIVNIASGILAKKCLIKFDINKIDCIDSILIISSHNSYYIIHISELIQDKFTFCKISSKGKLKVFPSLRMFSILQKDILEVFIIDQLLKPTFTYLLPSIFKECILWGRSIVAFDPGLSVVGKVPNITEKRVNKPLTKQKICTCNECSLRLEGIDYQEWIKKDKADSELWKNSEEIGRV